MTYKVITSYDLDQFTVLVNAALANGWSLAGGISVAVQHNQTRYAQAVIRESH